MKQTNKLNITVVDVVVISHNRHRCRRRSSLLLSMIVVFFFIIIYPTCVDIIVCFFYVDHRHHDLDSWGKLMISPTKDGINVPIALGAFRDKSSWLWSVVISPPLAKTQGENERAQRRLKKDNSYVPSKVQHGGVASLTLVRATYCSVKISLVMIL